MENKPVRLPLKVLRASLLALTLILLLSPRAQSDSAGKFPMHGSFEAWQAAWATYEAGVQLEDQESYDDAIKRFKEAVNIYPFDSAFFYHLGTCFFKKKEYVPAENMLNKALEIEPNCCAYRYSLGVLMYEERRLDEASRQFAFAIRCSPTDQQKENIIWYMTAIREERARQR